MISSAINSGPVLGVSSSAIKTPLLITDKPSDKPAIADVAGQSGAGSVSVDSVKISIQAVYQSVAISTSSLYQQGGDKAVDGGLKRDYGGIGQNHRPSLEKFLSKGLQRFNEIDTDGDKIITAKELADYISARTEGFDEDKANSIATHILRNFLASAGDDLELTQNEATDSLKAAYYNKFGSVDKDHEGDRRLGFKHEHDSAIQAGGSGRPYSLYDVLKDNLAKDYRRNSANISTIEASIQTVSISIEAISISV